MFTEEDKILIKVLRQEHGYGAKRFLKEFSNKGCCLSSVIKLLKKIDETSTVERKPGSGKNARYYTRVTILWPSKTGTLFGFFRSRNGSCLLNLGVI